MKNFTQSKTLGLNVCPGSYFNTWSLPIPMVMDSGYRMLSDQHPKTQKWKLLRERWERWKSESEVAQSCPTLCSCMDCSLPGSSTHGIFQARILEWVAIPFSRGSSQPKDQTCVSCTEGRSFIVWASRESLHCWLTSPPNIWTIRLSGSLMK